MCCGSPRYEGSKRMGRTFGAALCALTLLASSCAPKNYVALLENPDGGTGQVTVTTTAGQQTLDSAGAATSVNKADRAPSAPWEVAWDKIEEVFGSAFRVRPPRVAQYTIYFQSGTTDIAEVSKPTLEALLEDARNRPTPDADVYGHTDRVANERKNEVLALLRAYTVRDLLVEAGVSSGRIRVDSFGESQPAVETADNIAEIRNRRVEVTLR
jgi:outer membrane protein OmpA-like peptidoglycan-associated protein